MKNAFIFIRKSTSTIGNSQHNNWRMMEKNKILVSEFGSEVNLCNNIAWAFWVFLHFCSISWFHDSIEIAAELQIECVACITQKWAITDYWIKTEHQMTRLNVSMQKTFQEVVVAQVVEQLPSVCAGLSAFFRSELLSIYSHWVLGILL